jgi:protein-tyrosine phosphatase
MSFRGTRSETPGEVLLSPGSMFVTLKALIYAALILPISLTVSALDSQPPASVAGNTPDAVRERRSLGLEGAPNFRDIGGYAANDGRHVRWGRVFRSSELSKLTLEDQRTVDGLHIAALVDLRTAVERKTSVDLWTHAPSDVYESPKVSLVPVMQGILAKAQAPEGARSGFIDFYMRMPDDYKAEYSAMFHRLASGEVPMLVHCTAGKDRTGVAIAVLLTSVGVPRATVLGDYQLTETLVPAAAAAERHPAPVGGAPQAQSALAQLPVESRQILWRSDPAYVSAALDSIDREYGSVERYVEKALGLTKSELRTIRRELLQ